MAQDLIKGLEHLLNKKCINRNLNVEKIVMSTYNKTLKYCDFHLINMQDKN